MLARAKRICCFEEPRGWSRARSPKLCCAGARLAAVTFTSASCARPPKPARAHEARPTRARLVSRASLAQASSGWLGRGCALHVTAGRLTMARRADATLASLSPSAGAGSVPATSCSVAPPHSRELPTRSGPSDLASGGSCVDSGATITTTTARASSAPVCDPMRRARALARLNLPLGDGESASRAKPSASAHLPLPALRACALCHLCRFAGTKRTHAQ